MATEVEVLNYLKNVADYVREDTLVSFGATEEILQSLRSNYVVGQYQFADTDIANGLRVSVFDNNNYIYIDNNDWLNPLNSFTVYVKLLLNDYSSGTTRTLVSKYPGFTIKINSDDKYEVIIFNGTTDVVYTSTAANTLNNNTTYWLKFYWISKDENENSRCSIFYSTEDVHQNNDVIEWTLVEDITTTQHLIEHSSNNIFIGGLNNNDGEACPGIIYNFEFIGEGQERASFDFSYNSELYLYNDLIKDYYNNNLYIVGKKNFLIQNSESLLWYKYETNFGETSTI